MLAAVSSIGGLTLLGGDQQVIVRLATVLDVHLDIGMRLLDAANEEIQLRRVGALEEGDDVTRVGEHRRDDSLGDLVKALAADEWLVVGRPR